MKNKVKKDRVDIITQKTPDEIIIDTILSNEREFLFSPSAEQQLIDMHNIRELFMEHGSRSKVVEILVEEHNYKHSTAWKAVTVTPKLFSTIPQSLSRDFWVDIHLQKIEITWKMSKELGDTKSMAAADKNREVAIEKYLGTNQMIDTEKLHLPDVEIGFHPELFADVNDLTSVELEQIKNAFRRRKKLQQQREIQDIDHEEIH